MPSLRNVVGIVQNDKTLDLTACKKGNGSDTSLPTQDAEPADEVAEEFLVFFGCEFGNPVVLAA